MTHDDAFIQAIIEAPDDDGPRLVYADWLEDHGQPERAEFIRVQCELARMPAGDPRRVELEARERELVAAYGKVWLGPLVGLVSGGWQFRRGFVECITMYWRGFWSYGDYILRLAPVREVKLWGCWVRELASSPLVGRLARIDLRGSNLEDWAAEVLVASPYLSNVALDLRDNLFTDKGKQVLVGRFGDRVLF